MSNPSNSTTARAPHPAIAPSPNPSISKSPCSPRKAAANRANSQRSAGPRTPAGKERVSQNAVTHGLLVGSLRRLLALATPDERETYTQVIHQLYEEVKPHGAREHLLVERLATAYLRQFRIHRVEAQVMAERLRDAADSQAPIVRLPSNLEVILRYDTQTDHAIQRTLRQLSRLQRDRHRQDAAVDREALRLLGGA